MSNENETEVVIDLNCYLRGGRHSFEELKEIRQSHLDRIKQGEEVWNKWANAVERALRSENEAVFSDSSAITRQNNIRNNYFIDFRNINFGKEIDFSSLEFPIAVNFSSSEFYGTTNFELSNFKAHACFELVKFQGMVNFQSSKFFDGVVFNLAKFNGYSIFENTKVRGTLEFRKAEFLDDATFCSATFYDYVDFNEANFFKKVSFNDVKFQSGFNFDVTSFSQVVDFSQADFTSNIIAKDSRSLMDLGQEIKDDFYYVSFEGMEYVYSSMSFVGANFKDTVLFRDVEINRSVQGLSIVDFRQTSFHEVPSIDFVPSSIRSLKLELLNLTKNRNVKEGKGNSFIEKERKIYKSAKEKYGALKSIAEKNNQHKKSLEFYACELYCQRMATDGFKNPDNWANYFYDWFSGYGLSLKKPLRWWFFISILCVSLQSFMDKSYYFSWSDSGKERVSYYIAPSLPPFMQDSRYQAELRYRLYPEILDIEKPKGAIPIENRLIRGIQTFFTFLSIFFFGLGLRNLFKIK